MRVNADLSMFVSEKQPLSHEEELWLAGQRISAEQKCCTELYTTDIGRTLLAYALNLIIHRKAGIIEKQFPVKDGYQAWYELIKKTQNELRKKYEKTKKDNIEARAREQNDIAEKILTLPIAHALFPTIIKTVGERKGHRLPTLYTQTKKFYRVHINNAFGANKEYKQAVDALVEHNLRLVVSFAKKYSKNPRFNDIISEGQGGLIHAAEIYNPFSDEYEDNKFNSVAAWWIKARIKRKIHEFLRNVKYPNYLQTLSARVEDFQNMFANEHFREPALEEIAAGMEITKESVKAVLNYRKDEKSLDVPVGYGGENLYELIEYPNTLLLQEKHELLIKAIKMLPKRLREVIQYRTGLNGKTSHTLDECKGIFKISRERVRQLEVIALQKIGLQLINNPEVMDEYGRLRLLSSPSFGKTSRNVPVYKETELLTLDTVCNKIREYNIEEFINQFYATD
ncbi:sigma-70 family RNA polymerase sigma factor [Candidatus Woesearchaeota archaeon]|nr:sigma-70 family RNA polymerase sigma factor [Candidatus Woesearchaeota archaeon]